MLVDLLVRRFVPDHQRTQDPRVRARYGALSGGVGIALNLLLFALKLLAGAVTASIAVVADAFNNLSDAGSSIVTLVGFRMAERPADDEHPFGHGRIEYLSGLFVSAAILVVGVELLKSSFDKVLHPAPTEMDLPSLCILVCAVGVKLWMSRFNRALSARIGSTAMAATAKDSLTDAVATSAVVLGVGLGSVFHLYVDGWIGLAVAGFILYTGYTTARDSLSPLLGQSPDPEFVQEITQTVLAHPEVVGIHDLIVHDYGPGQRMISLHAEVRADEDILVIHDVIDRIEMELRGRFRCETTIHMDPIAVDDEATASMRARVEQAVHGVDPALSIHDFRMVVSPTHTNLIFDVCVPHRFRMTDAQVSRAVHDAVRRLDGPYFAVIRVEHGYL